MKGVSTMNFKNRSFLKLLDYTPAEIEYLLDLAADLKQKKKEDSKKGVLFDALLIIYLKTDNIFESNYIQ